MERNRNLLLWILGGLSLVTFAIAIAMGSRTTFRTVAPTGQSVPPPSVAPALPVTPALSAAPETPRATSPEVATFTPAPSDAPAGGPAEVAAAPEASGQIWACSTNGVKTFSNNPCGEKSTLLDVGPINTMNATRVLPSHTYPPDMHFAPDYPSDEPADQPEVESASYGVSLVPYYVRRRPIHDHPAPHLHPAQHNRGPQPRNY